MRTRAIICAAVGALVVAAPADAATVELKSRTEGGIKGPDVIVTIDPAVVARTHIAGGTGGSAVVARRYMVNVP